MRVILADVMSLNGKITRGTDPDISSWSSSEDFAHFQKLKGECDVIIIDRKTYEAAQPEPEVGKLRIVFTSTPERFSDVSSPGTLEFVNESPATLVEHLAKAGHERALLAGGARLSSDFLHAQLVDEVYVSIEPVLFGTGRPMLDENSPNVSLQLKSVTELNKRGTLLAHYLVIRTD